MFKKLIIAAVAATAFVAAGAPAQAMGSLNGSINGWGNGSFNGWGNGAAAGQVQSTDGHALRVIGIEVHKPAAR